jgi:hypothetical protein
VYAEPYMEEGVSGVQSAESRQPISLYEFYVLSITHLLAKAPWELVRAVSEYHGNFLTEQRCIGLSILLLVGENHVPADAAESMPKYEAQVRASVNQATFRRALKHYFAEQGIEASRTDLVLERMHSYVTDSRQADAEGQDPLEAMAAILVKRVPPKTNEQRQLYEQRVVKIFEYIEELVEGNLLQRYRIAS